MDLLYSILKWVLGAVGTVVLGLLVNYITPLFRQDIIDQYIFPGLLCFALLSIATLVVGYNRRKSKRHSQFELCKTTDKLTPEDLGFTVFPEGQSAQPGERPYHSKYISRQFRSHRESDRSKGFPSTDIEVLKKIKEGYNLLLIGQPTEGKTRTAYELLKGLSDYTVVSIKHDGRLPSSDAFNIFKGKSVVLFIDDLSDYVGYPVDITRLFRDIKEVAQRCVIIATCRDGGEYAQVTGASTGTIQRLHKSFTYELSLIPITDHEKKELAEESGYPLVSKDISVYPTPGWIVMKDAIKIMENRFRHKLSPVAVDTLYSIKLLALAGVLRTHQRVANLMRDVFQREGFHLLDELTNLADNAFIKRPAEQDPIQPESAYLMMIVEYPQKKLLNDLVLLGQTLERSRDSEGLHSLSLCYFEWLRNYSEAHKYCEKAIKLNADFAEAWNTLGIISFELRQYKDAICAYQKATSITKSYRTAWYNLGNVYAQIKRHNEAASAYKQALEIDNNYYPAWVNLGNIHYLLGEPHKAQQAYRRATAINGDIYEAWSGLGNTAKQLGRSDKNGEAAIDAYQKALTIDGNAHEVWNNLSFTYYNLERYEEALETSRNAQRLAPHNPLYWAILGLTLSHLGQKEESFYWLCQAWKMQGALEISADDVKEAIIRIGYRPDDCN